MTDGRGLYRGIFSAMLDDPDYQALSAPAQHVLLTLRLSSQNTAACLFRLYPGVLAAQAKHSPRVLRAAVAELVRGRWLECEGPWERLDGPCLVWIRNGLRYDPSLSLSNANHRKSVLRALSAFGHSPLVVKFCEYYQITKPFEAHLKGLRMPMPIRSSTPTPTPTPKRKSTPTPKRKPITTDRPDGVSHSRLGSDGAGRIGHGAEPVGDIVSRSLAEQAARLRRDRGIAP